MILRGGKCKSVDEICLGAILFTTISHRLIRDQCRINGRFPVLYTVVFENAVMLDLLPPVCKKVDAIIAMCKYCFMNFENDSNIISKKKKKTQIG